MVTWEYCGKGGVVIILNRVVRANLTEKVPFGQRLERCNGVSHMSI